MKGYILLSRKIIESEVWNKPPLYLKVWIYLLNRAQYVDYKGLKRGQLYTSIPEIQEACSYMVGYRKEKPSKKEIWNILEFLRNPHERDYERDTKETMIETTKTTQGMLITVCNYNVYQDFNNHKGNDDGNDEKITKGTRRKRQGNNINKNNIKQYKTNKDIYSHEIHQVVDHLNAVTGKRRSADSKATSKHIRARLEEGATVTDMIAIIDSKAGDWLKDERMKKFIRPETLFSTAHFEDYLEEAKTDGKRHDPADWDESNGELI